MRVQHNVTALNSYRQLGANNANSSKNLEKLSSGYRINRAGDDAAGLAVSEKMRSQIRGLETAQKNAQDGISLVQTAEGALTEVHSMLNRMVELAGLSANGTIQDIDRSNYQSEIEALTKEIDRIAQGTNFNGINLLDGSLAGAGGAGGGSRSAVMAKTSIEGTTAITQGTAAAQEMEITLVASEALTAGDVVSFSIELDDGTNFSFSGKYDGTNLVLLDASGKETQTKQAATSAGATTTELGAFLKDGLEANEAFKESFSVDASGKITANANSFSTPQIKSATITQNGKTTAFATETTQGKGAYNTLDVTKLKAGDAANQQDAEIIEIGGQKFAYVVSEADAGNLDKDVNYVITSAGGNATADDVEAMVTLINQKTGLSLDTPSSGSVIDLINSAGGGNAGGGLTLQIGDTAASFNKITVSVDNMGASSLGINGIDISDQANSQAAIDKVNAAISKVSTNRGNLGALQNRLDHTINNLGVTTENLIEAESRIRDTDMAKEMMDFTKNSILMQSAQAMLAQANQLPQGVLQLLR